MIAFSERRKEGLFGIRIKVALTSFLWTFGSLFIKKGGSLNSWLSVIMLIMLSISICFRDKCGFTCNRSVFLVFTLLPSNSWCRLKSAVQHASSTPWEDESLSNKGCFMAAALYMSTSVRLALVFKCIRMRTVSYLSLKITARFGLKFPIEI